MEEIIITKPQLIFIIELFMAQNARIAFLEKQEEKFIKDAESRTQTLGRLLDLLGKNVSNGII